MDSEVITDPTNPFYAQNQREFAKLNQGEMILQAQERVQAQIRAQAQARAKAQAQSQATNMTGSGYSGKKRTRGKYVRRRKGKHSRKKRSRKSVHRKY